MGTETAQEALRTKVSRKLEWHKAMLRDKELCSSAKVVAGRLMHYHNDKSDEIFPCQETLGDEIGLERGTVNRLMRKLAARGWIKWRRTRGASRYELDLDRREGASVPNEAPGRPLRQKPAQVSDKSSPAEMCADRHIRCAPNDTSDVHGSAYQMCTDRHTEPATQPAKGTSHCNQAPDGGQPAGEIRLEPVLSLPSASVPDQANDNGDFDFMGSTFSIRRGGLDVLVEAFPAIDVLAHLPDIDTAIAAGDPMPMGEAIKMATNILRTRNRKAAGGQTQSA